MGFDSLQTGNHIASNFIEWIFATLYRFDSLQTGTPIASKSDPNITDDNIVFPFPSNGNAEHKNRDDIGIFDILGSSFPFPSNGNAHRK